MSTRSYISDDVGIFYEGPVEVLEALDKVYEEKRRLDAISKYHINDRVRITDNVIDIYKELYGDGSIYNHYDAWDLAKVLAGEVVTVEGQEYLKNYKNITDIYYTVSRDNGMFYVLPGYCLSSV